MHAVFVTSRVRDFEGARQELHERVVPTVSQAPGFVAGYWIAPTGQSGKGNAVMVFESEDAAREASERFDPPSGVEVESIEVREVVAHA